MDVNIPEVVAEVEAEFYRYESALVGNDIAVLDELFWASPETVRFGVGENLYGHRAISRFRSQRPVVDLSRQLLRTVITTHGQDLATTCAEFRRTGSGGVGRQSQTWVRMACGWRIVMAHVSLLPVTQKVD
jgi:hypothetical protein